MQYVIVGAGPAGVIAAETLRKADPAGGVTLLGDETEPPYSRMAIPYYLEDNIGEAGTYLRKGEGHYGKLNIEVRQARVRRVDTEAKRLALDGGRTLAFDKLLIATGASPIAPPIPGVDSPGVHPCWTLADARNIVRLATKGAKVVQMGAGFIGCIIVKSIVKRGVELTIVEMQDRMVPRMMDEVSGTLIKKWCESKRVAVHTSTRVTAIEATRGKLFRKGKLTVKLDSGDELEADLVINATGVRPNIGFLEGSGVKTDQGVLINEYMETNVPDIYAAGDVAQGLDFSTGEYSVQAIQPTAADHGRIAALNMAGHRSRHQGSVNMNVLDTMGLVSSSFGLWMGKAGGESAVSVDEENYRYLRLNFDDDVLVGAQALGFTQHVGLLRGLIQSKTKLGPWKKRLMARPQDIALAYLGRAQG